MRDPRRDAPHAPDWRADVRDRLRAAGLHPQDETQIVDEVAEHLEAEYADLAARLGPAAARARLLDQLGAPAFDAAADRRKRRARPAPTRVWTRGSLWRDVRYGLRSLRRSPGLVVAGAAALALGIGLTTMMFSVIYGMLIRGLPFDGAPRIAMVRYVDAANSAEDGVMALGDFVRWRARQRSFEHVGGMMGGTVTVSGADAAERVSAARLTSGTFEITRVRPLLGRTFVVGDDDPAAPPIAVLGHALWRDRFGGDSGVIGRTVRVDGREHTIVGVMPERYAFPRAARLWIPFRQATASMRPGEGPGLLVVGRLRAGVSYAQAQAELEGMTRQIAVEQSDAGRRLRVIVQPFVRGSVQTRVYALLYAMLGAVFLVLLVACANVANLLLDRAASRTREIGIRTALGASRLAIVRQSLVESSLLAALAALLGTAIAQGGILAFNRAIADVERPFWMDVRLHPAVLGFVLATATFASLVAGLLPALQSARLDVGATLKDESLAASSLRVGRISRIVVGVEIALSSALLVASGFLTKSIVKLRAVEPGFVAEGVYTAGVSASATDAATRRRFFQALEARLGALPGATGAYVGSGLPGTGWSGSQLAIEGHGYAREQDYPSVRTLAVSPGFFATFGVRVLRGRPLAAADREGAPRVAVISESFARRHFPGVDPLGRRFRLGDADDRAIERGDWVTVVGVVPTLFSLSMRNPWPPEVLTSLWQARDAASAVVAVRGPADVASVAAIRRAVGALDAEAPVYAPAPMSDVLARETWAIRILGSMFVTFGIVSLALAAIGLYAVMAFSVSRRTRELGIRVSLGATGWAVVRMVVRQGATQIVAGMAVGFLAGGAMVRGARAALFEVEPGDPSVFAVVAAVLGVAALVACLIPALRATRVDPLVALRTE